MRAWQEGEGRRDPGSSFPGGLVVAAGVGEGRGREAGTRCCPAGCRGALPACGLQSR